MASNYILYFALLFIAIITASAVVLLVLLAVSKRSRRKSTEGFEHYASFSNLNSLVKTN